MNYDTDPKFMARLTEPDVASLSYKDAFEVLNAEEVTQVGILPLATLVDKLSELDALLPLQQAAAAGTMPAVKVVSLLQTLRDYGGTGVNMKPGHHHRALLDSLVAAGQLTVTVQQTLVDLVTTTSKRWLGLKPGNIQNARYQMTGQRQEK